MSNYWQSFGFYKVDILVFKVKLCRNICFFLLGRNFAVFSSIFPHFWFFNALTVKKTNFFVNFFFFGKSFGFQVNIFQFCSNFKKKKINFLSQFLSQNWLKWWDFSRWLWVGCSRCKFATQLFLLCAISRPALNNGTS